MKKKKWIIWVIILLAVGGGVFWRFTRKPAVQYITQSVQKDTIRQTVSVTGDVLSRDEVQLSFQRPGKISHLLVDVGDRVEEGQVLGTIDDSTIRTQIKQSNADIVYQTETYDNMKSHRDLFSKDQRQAQRALVDRSKVTRDGNALLLKETIIKTPITGTVTKRDGEEGEVASVNAPVFTVTGDTGLVIKANVPESDIVSVKVGQSASITFDALSMDQTFDAKVTDIEPAATVIQDVVYYKVTFELDKPNDQLKPGMSCDIDIHVAEKEDVLVVPERAVRESGGKKTVQVLADSKKNIVSTVDVKTGLSGDGGMIEIISGLKVGDQVVVSQK